MRLLRGGKSSLTTHNTRQCPVFKLACVNISRVSPLSLSSLWLPLAAGVVPFLQVSLLPLPHHVPHMAHAAANTLVLSISLPLDCLSSLSLPSPLLNPLYTHTNPSPSFRAPDIHSLSLLPSDNFRLVIFGVPPLMYPDDAPSILLLTQTQNR